MRLRMPKFALACALISGAVGLSLLLAWRLGWSWLIQVLPMCPGPPCRCASAA